MTPHGLSTNGGLSSGGGPHAPGDDLFTQNLVPSRSLQTDANGGSHLRDDPGYSQVGGDDEPGTGPTDTVSDTAPYPAILYASEAAAQGEDPTQMDKNSKDTSPFVDSAGNRYTEPNELREHATYGENSDQDGSYDYDSANQKTGAFTVSI